MKNILSPTFWSWFHASATIIWMLLLIPALLVWERLRPIPGFDQRLG